MNSPRLVARAVHAAPVEIVPAPSRREWPDGASALFEDPSLQSATGRGWDLLCPHSFEATWNGGPAPEDIEIRPPGFAVSEAGHGVLTLQTGLQVALDDGHHLWVRGPINHLKDGLQPLDQVIESDLLPFIVRVNWRFTRPGQTVRFERGEPFGTILPYPAGYVEAFELEFEAVDGDAQDEAESRPGPLPDARPSTTDGESKGEELPPIAFRRLPRPMPDAEALALFRGDHSRRISVILPACNERPYLERTFRQVLATLPPRSEIVVVDNGSSDGCADFLAHASQVPAADRPGPVEIALARTDVAVRLLRTDVPLGVVGARNLGLAHARGEVIAFADANVDLPPGWWAPLVATLNRPGVGMVGPAIGEYGEPEGARACGRAIVDARLHTEWILLDGEEPHPVDTLAGTLMVMRRAILDEVGPFDAGMRQRASEDLEISLRLLLFGYALWAVPEVDAPHLFRPRSPYPVDGTLVLYNQLRVGFLHLGGQRLARFVDGWREHPSFGDALALVADSDVFARRAELAARRRHDDAWLFECLGLGELPLRA